MSDKNSCISLSVDAGLRSIKHWSPSRHSSENIPPDPTFLPLLFGTTVPHFTNLFFASLIVEEGISVVVAAASIVIEPVPMMERIAAYLSPL